MSWLFSKALIEAYENSRCLPERVEAYSAENSSDGEPSAQLNVMPTQRPFWRNDKTMDISTYSPFGLTSKPLTEDRGEALLTWFRGAFLAKHGATLLEAEIMARICGHRCSVLWAKSNLKLFSPKTWTKAQSSWLRQTLPCVDIKQTAVKFQRKTWVQTIIGHDGGYLHTPTTKANYAAQSMQKWKCCRNYVAVFGKPNPIDQEWMMGWPLGWTDLKP